MSISYQHAQFSSLHILFRIIEINSSLFSLFVISLVNDSSSRLTLLSEHVEDSFPLENIFQKTIYFFKALSRGLNLLGRYARIMKRNYFPLLALVLPGYKVVINLQKY